jgi:hypothetical protein
MTERIHYLYVISAIENDVPVAPCKIGITSSLASRLSGIQTGNAKKLEIVSAIPIPTRALVQAIEKELHDHFEEFRLVGEWFNLGPVDAAIGACTVAHDAFMMIIPDEAKAYGVLENLGIVAEISRCFEFIEGCHQRGIALETRFNPANPGGATLQ